MSNLCDQARSPLRYPGGKSRAVKALSPLVPLSVKEICSPFLGGANLELALTLRGVRVWGYDNFCPLINFWKNILEDSRLVASKAREQYFPLGKKAFYALQKHFYTLEDSVVQAAVFFVLNRASFSGTTLSGGMSPGHPRLTESSFLRLENFKNDRLSVHCLDFEEACARHPDTFLYLDPPYYLENSNNLYGNRGDMHKDFDHERLARVLHRRTGWLLSYNDCPTIRSLYKGYKTERPRWRYGMNNYKQSFCKKSNEISILSL